MKPSELSERQKKMILEQKLSDKVLGERFGMHVTAISLVRKKLKDAGQ